MIVRTLTDDVICSREHVLSTRFSAGLPDPFEENCRSMDAVYAGSFDEGKRSAHTTVGVTSLISGARIEIDAIARRP